MCILPPPSVPPIGWETSAGEDKYKDDGHTLEFVACKPPMERSALTVTGSTRTIQHQSKQSQMNT